MASHFSPSSLPPSAILWWPRAIPPSRPAPGLSMTQTDRSRQKPAVHERYGQHMLMQYTPRHSVYFSIFQYTVGQFQYMLHSSLCVCIIQVGTTVTLHNLFHTLPVRHKEFQRNLKKVAVEHSLNKTWLFSLLLPLSPIHSPPPPPLSPLHSLPPPPLSPLHSFPPPLQRNMLEWYRCYKGTALSVRELE